MVFAVRFHDAQCGFKAMRSDVARLPTTGGAATTSGFSTRNCCCSPSTTACAIHEVPVDWVDDPDSRVDVAATARADLRGVRRVLWTFLRGGGQVELGSLERSPPVDDLGRQTVSFLVIGTVSTLVSLVLFLLLRDPWGRCGPTRSGSRRRRW